MWEKGVVTEERCLMKRLSRPVVPRWPTGPFFSTRFRNVLWYGTINGIEGFHDRLLIQLSDYLVETNTGRWGFLVLKMAVLWQRRIPGSSVNRSTADSGMNGSNVGYDIKQIEHQWRRDTDFKHWWSSFL